MGADSTSSRKAQALSANVTPFPSPDPGHQGELRAPGYWPLVPDAVYLAACTHTYWDRKSRTYGERIYVYFRIIEGAHTGKKLRMHLTPSTHPTSNFYRAWAIANDGPPTGRTRFSPRIFTGKIFRVRTATVKPRHRVSGADGKVRAGPPLPNFLWYSKVDCLLTLEVTNHPLRQTSPTGPAQIPTQTPVSLPAAAPKSLSTQPLGEGQVGWWDLGVGDWEDSRQGIDVKGDLGQSTRTPNPAGSRHSASLPVASPSRIIAPMPRARTKRKSRKRGGK